MISEKEISETIVTLAEENPIAIDTIMDGAQYLALLSNYGIDLNRIHAMLLVNFPQHRQRLLEIYNQARGGQE